MLPQQRKCLIYIGWKMIFFLLQQNMTTYAPNTEAISPASYIAEPLTKQHATPLQFWYNGWFYICHVVTVRTVCENIMDAINSVEDQCVLLDPISWLFCNITYIVKKSRKGKEITEVVYRAGKLNLMKRTIKRVLPTFEEFTGDKLTSLLKNNNNKVRLATF